MSTPVVSPLQRRGRSESVHGPARRLRLSALATFAGRAPVDRSPWNCRHPAEDSSDPRSQLPGPPPACPPGPPSRPQPAGHRRVAAAVRTRPRHDQVAAHPPSPTRWPPGSWRLADRPPSLRLSARPRIGVAHFSPEYHSAASSGPDAETTATHSAWVDVRSTRAGRLTSTTVTTSGRRRIPAATMSNHRRPAAAPGCIYQP